MQTFFHTGAQKPRRKLLNLHKKLKQGVAVLSAVAVVAGIGLQMPLKSSASVIPLQGGTGAAWAFNEKYDGNSFDSNCELYALGWNVYSPCYHNWNTYMDDWMSNTYSSLSDELQGAVTNFMRDVDIDENWPADNQTRTANEAAAANGYQGIRQIDSFYSYIEPNEYRVCMRIGDHNSHRDYHFMVQTNQGFWASKNGNTSPVLYQCQSPNDIDWANVDGTSHFYDSEIKYFAVKVPFKFANDNFVENFGVDESGYVHGFAWHTREPFTAYNVQIYLDGVLKEVMSADAVPPAYYMNEYNYYEVYGSHWFSYQLTGMSVGTHSVTCKMVDQDGNLEQTATHSFTYAPYKGFLDVVDDSKIQGWAYNEKIPDTNVQVHVYVDNQLKATVLADELRSDVMNGNDVGFTYNIDWSTYPPGTHTVKACGVLPDGTEYNLPVSAQSFPVYEKTYTVTAPTGYLDMVNDTSIQGWVWNQTYPNSPLQVEIDVNGKPKATVSANIYRSDLPGNGNHEYNYAMDWSTYAPGTYTVNAYAVYSDGTKVALANTKTYTVSSPTGYLDIVGDTSIQGWVWNQTYPNSPLQVEIDVNGTPKATVSANLYRGDLPGNKYHEFNYAMDWSTYAPGTYTVNAYAVYSNGTKVALTNTKTYTIYFQPVGFLDVADATSIQGWTWCESFPNDPLNVEIDIDGKSVATVSANLYRGDLPGNKCHEFNYAMDWGSYAPGNHQVQAFTFDTKGNKVALTNTKTYTVPTTYAGHVGANDQRISGYAYNIAAPNDSVNVEVDLDGVAVATVAANVYQSGLPGNGMHAFSFAMDWSNYPGGDAQLQLYAVDGSGKKLQLIASNSFPIPYLPEGALQVVDATHIAGWTWLPDCPSDPLSASIYINGVKKDMVLANLYQDGLPGNGYHAFSYAMDWSGYAPGTYEVSLHVYSYYGKEIILPGTTTYTVQ